jgi:hypothetical protein
VPEGYTTTAEYEHGADQQPVSDLGRLPGLSLIPWLDNPSSVTGNTHLCFGRLAMLSPTKKHPPDPHPLTFPSQPGGKMNHVGQINP